MLLKRVYSSTHLHIICSSPSPRFRFSRHNPASIPLVTFLDSPPPPKVTPYLQDWEYTRQIADLLKLNRGAQAFNLLLTSYFNGQVLDIQTYNSLQLSLSQFPISYEQVLYKVFRSQFQPHHLMQKFEEFRIQWMNRLADRSKDGKIRQMLGSDFKTLGITAPKSLVKVGDKEQKQTSKQKNEHSNKVFSVSEPHKLSATGSQPQQMSSNSSQKNGALSLPPPSFMGNRSKGEPSTEKYSQSSAYTPYTLPSELQALLNQIFKANCKVILHDLEFDYETSYQDEEQLSLQDGQQHLYEQDLQDHGMNSKNHNNFYNQSSQGNQASTTTTKDTVDWSSFLAFTKIKIGKVEFIGKDYIEGGEGERHQKGKGRVPRPDDDDS